MYRAVRKEAFKGYGLKNSFGISFDEYESLYKNQNGKCLICDQEETTIIRGVVISLAVDHCHKTKKIRGLLCSLCNRGLGFFKNDPERLERAAHYLRWPERLI